MITLACHPGLTVLVEATGLHSGNWEIALPQSLLTNGFVTPRSFLTKGFATSWEKVYFVPVSCFLCFTVGNFLGRLVGFSISLGVKSANSGDASPPHTEPYADPLAHLAKSPSPSPLPRLQPGSPQTLLHPRPHPLWHSLHLPHARLQYLHWNSHQVFFGQCLCFDFM